MENRLPKYLIENSTKYLVMLGMDNLLQFCNQSYQDKFGTMSSKVDAYEFTKGLLEEDLQRFLDAKTHLLKHPKQEIEIILHKISLKESSFQLTKWQFSLVQNITSGWCLVGSGEELQEDLTGLNEVAELVGVTEQAYFDYGNKLLVINENWELVQVNEHLENILGLNETQLVGKQLWNFFDFNSNLEFAKYLQASMEVRTSHAFLTTFQQIPHSFNILAFPFEDGIALLIKEAGPNETTEIHPPNSVEILAAQLQNSMDSVFLIDTQYRVISLNKVALAFNKRLFNKEIEVGECILDYIIKGTKLQFIKGFELALSGKVCKFEIDVGKSLGYPVWKDVIFYPVFNEHKQVAAVSFNTTSISERKLLESKLVHQNEMLKSISWQQSHEVRRPLANILGLLHLLNQTNDPNDFMEYYPFLNQSAQELDLIVKKIITRISELEHEKSLDILEDFKKLNL